LVVYVHSLHALVAADFLPDGRLHALHRLRICSAWYSSFKHIRHWCTIQIHLFLTFLLTSYTFNWRSLTRSTYSWWKMWVC